MNQLTEFLVNSILEEDKNEIIGIYGGGFKPPIKGHVAVVEKALQEFPEMDKLIVSVGSGVRDEIDQEESLLVWDIYQRHLPLKVEIGASKSGMPIKDIYKLAKENLDKTIYWFIGAREGREDDLQDITSRTKNADKYGNLNVKVVTTSDPNISGTNARKALLAGDKEKFFTFLPDFVTDEEKEEIYTILRPAVTEQVDFKSLESQLDNMFAELDIDVAFTNHFKERVIERGLTEEDIIELANKIIDQYPDELDFIDKGQNIVMSHLSRLVDIAAVNTGYGDDYLKDLVFKTAYKRKDKSEPEFRTNASSPRLAVNEHSMGNSIDLLPYLSKLTQHMIDKGYNIEPLPGLELIDDDFENAEDFFGKTAYYDPVGQIIVLYTHGRHPKDIARSYTHEMIHHIQNLEGRLDNITTTNTQEDDHLNDIEAEANLKGTMTFRNWTDSLNEAKKEINNSMVAVLSKKGNQISLYDFDNKEPLGLINTYGNEVNGVAAKKGYGPLMYELGMANVYPNGLQSDRNGNTEPEAEAVLNKFIEGVSPNIEAVKLTPNDKDYKTHYPNGNELFDVDNFYNYKFYNADTSILKQLLQKGNELSPNEQSTIISATEEMYDSMVNEANLRGKVKDPFGLNAFAYELARLDEEDLLNEGRYDKFVNYLSRIAFEAIKDGFESGRKVLDVTFTVRPPEDEPDIESDMFEFDFQVVADYTQDVYKVDGGANEGIDDDGTEITPLLIVNFGIPKNPKWSTVSMDLKDVVRHELEHLTQSGDNVVGVVRDPKDSRLDRPGKQMADDQFIRDMIDADMLPKADYFKLEKEIDAMMQGLYFKAKKSKRPFKDVIDDYLATQPISQEEKEVILNLWRSRNKALNLPVFENEEKVMDYRIFLDMDGVLVDFDQQFKDLTGMMPREFESKYSTEEFWEKIDKAGVGFWRGMKWMPGGEALYNRAAQHDHFLLSSPSRSEVSKIGKRLWRRDKTPNTKLYLARSYNKRKFAAPNHILIDDRADNIQQWKDAGGIGILYKSADQVNAELDKLGL